MESKQQQILYKRLAVLKPTGEVFVNGLAGSYDDEFPATSELGTVITEEEFSKAITKINDALQDHWPCLPCTSFAYGCCICTLGLSLYCASTQVREAEMRVDMQIRRINDQANFQSKGIKWRLVRVWYRRASYIEITIKDDNSKANDYRGGKESNTVSMLNVKEDDKRIGASVQEEIMSDRIA